jgi:hypothetical protein
MFHNRAFTALEQDHPHSENHDCCMMLPEEWQKGDENNPMFGIIQNIAGEKDDAERGIKDSQNHTNASQDRKQRELSWCPILSRLKMQMHLRMASIQPENATL